MNLARWGWSGCVFAVAIAVVLLISAGVSYSQSAAYATITGRVLDPGSASVPQATVTARNFDTGLARTSTTTSDGIYRFDNLPPGTYNVTVEASGFTKSEVNGVKLQVGESRDVNFGLELQGQKQQVVVSSELPLIEATKTDTSTVIDDKSVADLPTTTSYQGIGGVANDYQGLAASAPGVKYDYSGNSSDITGPGNVNDRGVVINVDGANISDQVVSARDALGASVEEVKEFQVLTNNYNAEYGQAGNIILNVITKSGTNQVHGDWHSYFRGRNLAASDSFFNTGFAGATAPPQADNREGCPLNDFNRAGNLKSISGCPRAPFFKHENGFTVGGPFVKDRIFWFGSYEKVAQGFPATLTPFNTPVTVNQPTNEILWSGKVDAKLTEKHTLTIRYNVQRDLQDNLLVQTGPNTDPSGLVSSVIHDNGFNVGLVSAPTVHTVNEARFFWHRFLSETPTKSTQPGQQLPNAYVGADFCCPQGALQDRFQYIDNVSYSRGSHTIKAGINFSHFPFDSTFQQFHFGRYEAFNGKEACAPFNQCPTQFTVGAGPGFVHAADNIYGAYLQDTWQIRKNVTFNYGLRYDIEDGAFRGGTIQNPSVKGGCLQANGLIPACGSDKNNWQPRLGIAWTPSYESGILHFLFGNPGKSVVRLAGAEVTELAYLNVVLDSLNFDGRNLLTATIASPNCFNANGSPVSLNTLGTADQQACTVLQAYPNSPTPSSLLSFTNGSSGFFGRVRPISPTIKNPEIHEASLSIQRQLGPSFTTGIGYQGVFGAGLFGETDENLPAPVTDPNHPGFFYLPGRPNPLFGAERTNFSNRTSTYHSLVVTAQKRLSHHFQFQGSYTFSKTLATGEDFFGLSEPGNPFASLKLDRALAQNDIRHLGNFSFVADTKNLFHAALVNHPLNNWTFGLLGTLQSGRPFPVSTGDGAFVGSIFPGLGAETLQRPNICTTNSTVPGCADQPIGTLVATNVASASGSNLEVGQSGVAACQAASLANCAALQTTFDAPAGASTRGPVDSFSGRPVDFQFFNGNLVRNAGQSLPLYRFDTSVTKAFKIPKWESSSLELKLEAFNIFNTPLFILNNGNDALNVLSLPSLTTTNAQGNTIPNPNFNCATTCINPFTGLYLGANGRPLNIADFQRASVKAGKNFSGLGSPSSDVTSRILQLAIRFRW